MGYTKSMFKNRKKTTTSKNDKSIAKIAKGAVLGMMETRKFLVAANETAVNSFNNTPLFVGLTGALTQNSGYSGFTGHVVKGVSIDLRFGLYNPNAFSKYFRMIVVRAKKPTQSDSTAQVLEDNSSNLTITGGVSEGLYRVNTDKYEVLRDILVKLGPVGTSDDATIRRVRIPYKRVLRYDGTSDALHENRVLMIYWAFDSRNDSVGAESIEISYASTFYYKDI